MFKKHTNKKDHCEPFWQRKNIIPLFFLCCAFYVTFLARIIFSPLLPVIKAEFALSNTRAGGIFFFISAGYFAGMLCSGFVSSFLHHNKTIVVSAAGAGLLIILTAIVPGQTFIWPLLLFLGILAGFYLPSGISTLTDVLPPEHWGKGIAIHEIAPNLAFVTAPLICELMMNIGGWRSVPFAIGILSITIAAGFAFFGKGGGFPGTPPGFSKLVHLFSIPSFYILILMFGLGIGSTIGCYSMLPLYLISESNLSRTVANFALSASRFLGLISAILCGWAADRLGPKKTAGILLFATGISTIYLGLAATKESVIFAVMLQAILSTGFFPAGFSLLSSISAPSERNLVISFAIPSAFVIGGGVLPGFLGYMADAGLFSTGFIVIGFAISAGAFLTILIRPGQVLDSRISSGCL